MKFPALLSILLAWVAFGAQLEQRTGPSATVTGARNLLRGREICESSQDRVRQAKAERIMVLCARVRAWLRYRRSLAWWQATSMRWTFDPVGEIF